MHLQQHVDLFLEFHVQDHRLLSNLERDHWDLSKFHHCRRTDIDNFMSECGEFITETELINSLFVCCFLDLIVLFFSRLIEHSSGWTF